MKSSFTLYKEICGEERIFLYIEEIPEEKTYYIKVECDIIDEELSKITLPERLKQELRADIVNIVRGYNIMMTGKIYNEQNVALCNEYFRYALDKFCMIHGSFYKYREEEK